MSLSAANHLKHGLSGCSAGDQDFAYQAAANGVGEQQRLAVAALLPSAQGGPSLLWPKLEAELSKGSRNEENIQSSTQVLGKKASSDSISNDLSEIKKEYSESMFEVGDQSSSSVTRLGPSNNWVIASPLYLGSASPTVPMSPLPWKSSTSPINSGYHGRGTPRRGISGLLMSSRRHHPYRRWNGSNGSGGLCPNIADGVRSDSEVLNSSVAAGGLSGQGNFSTSFGVLESGDESMSLDMDHVASPWHEDASMRSTSPSPSPALSPGPVPIGLKRISLTYPRSRQHSTGSISIPPTPGKLSFSNLAPNANSNLAMSASNGQGNNMMSPFTLTGSIFSLPNSNTTMDSVSQGARDGSFGGPTSAQPASNSSNLEHVEGQHGVINPVRISKQGSIHRQHTPTSWSSNGMAGIHTPHDPPAPQLPYGNEMSSHQLSQSSTSLHSSAHRFGSRESSFIPNNTGTMDSSLRIVTNSDLSASLMSQSMDINSPPHQPTGTMRTEKIVGSPNVIPPTPISKKHMNRLLQIRDEESKSFLEQEIQSERAVLASTHLPHTAAPLSPTFPQAGSGRRPSLLSPRGSFCGKPSPLSPRFGRSRTGSVISMHESTDLDHRAAPVTPAVSRSLLLASPKGSRRMSSKLWMESLSAPDSEQHPSSVFSSSSAFSMQDRMFSSDDEEEDSEDSNYRRQFSESHRNFISSTPAGRFLNMNTTEVNLSMVTPSSSRGSKRKAEANDDDRLTKKLLVSKE